MHLASVRSTHLFRFTNGNTLGSAAIRIVFLFCFVGCGNSKDHTRGMGPLTDIVFSGPVDGWVGSMEDGFYWLENEAGDPNDIRYFYTAPSQNNSGERFARVDIMTGQLHPEGRAGLLYGYRESPRFYYLIVVSGSGEIEIYRRDDDGFNLSQSSSIPPQSDTVHLEVREKGRQLTIHRNGETISTMENDDIGKGSLGIAAFGLGKFGFTNYAQTESGELLTENSIRPEASREQPIDEAKTKAKLSMLEFIDPKTGMVQYRSPYPSGWRYDTNPNDQLVMTAPGGVQVYQTDSGRFVYSNDSFALQSAQQAGAQVAPVMPLQQFLTQRFSPYMEQRGFKLSTQYPMPQIVEFWELFGAAMPQGLSRKQFDAIGAEWENSDGTRAFTILLLSILQDQTYVTWNVSVGELYAPRSEFESAKEAYAYASANIEMNPQWQIFMNNQLLAKIKASDDYWRDRTKASQAQHVARMNAILARGETSSSIAKINSDILDIGHAGYLNRSNMVGAGQAKTVNMIGGHSVISNPNTGELYKVEGGAQNYWVNAEGKYFQTDNSLYDPRTDSSISDQQWVRFEVAQ